MSNYKKRYRISRYYLQLICLFAIPLGVIVLGIGVYALIGLRDYLMALYLLFMGGSNVILCLFLLLCDPLWGMFSLDENGITVHTGFKSLSHNWDKIVDCGVIKLYTGNRYTFWIFFSERILSSEERKAFFRKTRRDLENIAFFQFEKSLLDEIAPLIPHDFAEKINEELILSGVMHRS